MHWVVRLRTPPIAVVSHPSADLSRHSVQGLQPFYLPPPRVCAWEGIRLMLRPLAIAIGMLAAMIPVHAAAHSLDRTSDGSTMRLSKKDDEAIMSHPMELLWPIRH